MTSVNPYFESQMLCSPFTYYAGGTRCRVSAAAKATTIFLTVILGIASFGILAVPVFYITVGGFRYSERRQHVYRHYPFSRPAYCPPSGYSSVNSSTIYEMGTRPYRHGTPSRRVETVYVDRGNDLGHIPLNSGFSSRPGPGVSAAYVPDRLPQSQGYGRPAVVQNPSFDSRTTTTQTNFGYAGGRGVPARNPYS